MEKNPLKVVLDTNVLISAILFGRKPKEIIKLVLEGKIIPITSQILFAELLEVLVKKFHFTTDKLVLAEELIKENFIFVNPSNSINVISDQDDNRVLEAAVEAKCKYIITGDQDLLRMGSFKNIKIVTPDTFLKYVKYPF